MINKLEFPLWLILHPAAFNYKRAIKEGSPLAVNSEWLQRKIPELPMISLQQLSDLCKQMRRTASDQLERSALTSVQSMAWNLSCLQALWECLLMNHPHILTLGLNYWQSWYILISVHVIAFFSILHTLMYTLLITAAWRQEEAWATVSPAICNLCAKVDETEVLHWHCALSHPTNFSYA